MLRKLTFLLLFLYAFSAYSQTVTYKNDQILVDKKPYALLKKSGNPLVRDFSLQNLDGKELALAKAHIIELPNNENYIYYTITFFPGGQQAEMENAMGFGKKLAEAVGKFELVKNNALNPEGVRKFLQVHNQKPSERYKNVLPVANATPHTEGLQYEIIDRNRQAEINIVGKSIQQDFKTIGTFTQTDQALRGKIIRTVRFMQHNGTLIAEATFEGLDAESCRLVTLRDNKMHHLPVEAQDIETPEQITRFLVERFYL